MTQGSPSAETPTDAPASPAGTDAAPYAETRLIRIKRLERELASAQKFSVRSTRQLHASMLKDVRDAEKRARQAEKRAEAAEERLAAVQKRARVAEAEVAAVRESSTWKAGRAVVAVPSQLKRWVRR